MVIRIIINIWAIISLTIVFALTAVAQPPVSPQITGTQVASKTHSQFYGKQSIISVGLRTADRVFMWRHGKSLHNAVGLTRVERRRWKLSLENLNRYKALGAKWNLVILHQGRDGPDGFKRARKAVSEYQQRSIIPVFRLIEDPAIYQKSGNARIRKKYLNSYYQWVRSVARSFQDSVHTYLIGNEIDSDLSYNLYGAMRKKFVGVTASYDQYQKILDTAYSAIKSVNPNLEVVNSGVSGFSLGLAVADDLLQSGHLISAQDFWSDFTFNRENEIISAARLTKLLNQSKNRRRIEIARESFLNSGNCDSIQLHYYGGWKALPVVLKWIDKLMQAGNGQSKTLIATEIGYSLPSKEGTAWNGRSARVADYGAFHPQLQAINTVKDFVILFGNNITRVEYWNMRTDYAKAIPAPLYKATMHANRFDRYPTATAFQVLANNLNGRTPSNKQLSYSGATTYTFTGSPTVTVMWSNGGNVRVNKDNFVGFQRVIGMYGHAKTSTGGEFVLSKKPVYVFWQAGD